jgi:hypothetical protein
MGGLVMLFGVICFTIICIILICLIETVDIPSDFKKDLFIIKILSFFTGIIFLVNIYFFMEFVNPSIYPMDVYSGKTTLEYTVVDGVKTDSCVVWKK